MPPSLSIVVVSHAMERELPRTVRTLDPQYQRGISADDYEVILVDNGSAVPPGEKLVESFSGTLHVHVLEDAPPSPARAANLGVAAAKADFIGLIVDGARMSSPGLLATALLARRLADTPIVATAAWHLGPVRHMNAVDAQYDQHVEDELLASVPWEQDGYSLFSISTLAGSSGRGWFGPLGESSALFMPRQAWSDLGGLDEAFVLPGGGLVNHDLYRRAHELPGVRTVVLLGEGTFHQFHGGAATSGTLTWDQMHAEYEALRGMPYKPPRRAAIYVGELHEPAIPHVLESARLAIDRAERAKARAAARAGDN
jgi:hypothetical protein